MANGPRLGRPMWVLLSGVLFTHFGTFMLMPLFSFILAAHKHLSYANVGLVIGAGFLAYMTGSLLSGFYGDRFGRKRMMVIGLLIRAVGLVLLVWMDSVVTLLVTNFFAGLGDGLYMPPAKAGIATLASEGTKTTAFSYRGIAANIGITLGPLAGNFLFLRSVPALFIGTAVVYGALAVAHVWLLERDCEPGVGDCPQVERVKFGELFRDRPFLVYSLVSVFVWVLFVQMTLSVPFRARQIEVVRNVSLIWTITSVFLIVLQRPVTKWMTKHLHPLHAMGYGAVIIGVGLGSVALSTSFWHLVASALVFTLGQMLVMPTSDAIVSDLARPALVSTYFGISAVVFGAGETLGSVGGGRLMESAVDAAALNLPWLVYGGIGLVTGGLFFALRLWRPLADPLTPVLQERTEQPAFEEQESKPLWRRKSKT